MKKRKLIKMDLFQIILYVIVTLYILSMIFILGFGLLNSLKYWVDYNTGNIFGLPREEYGWHFDNYVKTFNDFYITITPIGKAPRDVKLLEMFLNSVLYAGSISIFGMTTQVIMAYCISKYNFRLKGFLYSVAVVVLLIPIVGSLASEVQFANALGFQNNLIGICIMRCKYPGLYFLVFYAAFKSVSWSYSEAAQIDGAGHFRIFIQIMLPMIGGTLMAVFILNFIANWNEYYTQMIFLPNMPTLSYGLYSFQSRNDTAMSVPTQLTACILSCLPIIVLFSFCSKQIMGNVAIGGIKG